MGGPARPAESGDWDSDTGYHHQSNPEPKPAPAFASLQAWVQDYLAPLLAVELNNQVRWCPQWWRHPLAIARLEALWRSWEAARLIDEPDAASLWWRDHADVHLRELMEGPRSPFRQCTPSEHRDQLHPLPLQPAPPGWFHRPGPATQPP